jgi:elongator complex protein 3
LEYVTKKDKIAGFLRLSIPKERGFMKGIENTAIIREVHVYGSAVGIGKEEKGKAQHIGLGSKLMDRAEEIAVEEGFNEISVISSIGTREYYRKKGYEVSGLYQVKRLA